MAAVDVDYTCHKPSISKGLLRCPVCHRIGLLVRYTDGTVVYHHKGAGNASVVVITDFCKLKSEAITQP